MHSEPVSIDPEIANSMSSILVQWSKFEMGLVVDTMQLLRFPMAADLAEEAPRSFVKKIELWKKAVHVVFVNIDLYRHAASEICSAGKRVSRLRHHLVHGMWIPAEQSDGNGRLFKVFNLRGLHHLEQYDEVIVDGAYLQSVHDDCRTLADKLLEFSANRAMHGARGLLTLQSSP